MPRKFWMVVGHGPAQVRHDNRAGAESEAVRLARNNPGQYFYVVESIKCYVGSTGPVVVKQATFSGE